MGLYLVLHMYSLSRSKMLADLAKQELVTVDAATASKELRTELR